MHMYKHTQTLHVRSIVAYVQHTWAERKMYTLYNRTHVLCDEY